MISFLSIWAITVRHLLLWKRDPNLFLAIFYWPTLDIVTWGFLGSWIQQSHMNQFHNYEAIALLGVLLWQIVGRGCNSIGLAFAEELWSNNVINLFSLPLRITEWMCGVLLLYAITMCITTLVCMLIICTLYTVSLWSLLSTFFLFLPPLIFSSIWLGFTCLQIIVILGKRGVELGFVIVWFLLPFSGAYYPIAVLPQWGQIVAACLPMSYVFEGMREYLILQQDPTLNLIKAYALGILYAFIATLIFVYCFKKSKLKGLARLTD